MRRYSAIVAVVLAMGLAAGVRADDIWKWVDPQGTVHYSDRPVPGAVLVKGHDRASDNSASEPPPEQSSQQITDQLNKEEAARAVQKDESDARAKQCKQATDNYNKLIQARRIYNTDSSGGRQYLSDDQADQERVQARVDMETACGTNTQ
ncbi:MAG: DUF4124 domain-containing protein [Steroidobacteraceae bacterium]